MHMLLIDGLIADDAVPLFQVKFLGHLRNDDHHVPKQLTLHIVKRFLILLNEGENLEVNGSIRLDHHERDTLLILVKQISTFLELKSINF